MKSQTGALLCGLLLAGLAWPAAATAQERARFRAMDRNGDGVISLNEWRGNDESFRRHDRNGDGVLTEEEFRQAIGTSGRSPSVPGFAFVDYDGNGKITAQEWMRAFNGLDVDGNGVLTEDELAAASISSAGAETPAFRSGRDRGLSDGRQAGREDRARGTWDLEGQSELEGADAGYRSELGPLAQYQSGYREGFRQGYAEGYGPRR
jgi:hypothetical protein